MVKAGLTVILLPVTIPTLGLMLTLVAPLTVQDRVLLEPAEIVDGDTEKVLMVGFEVAPTVTVRETVLLPALLVAVRV